MLSRTGIPAIRGRGLQQGVHFRVRAQERGAIPVRQPGRKLDAESGQQRREVAAPRDRHRDIADRVLEDQIPADDPGNQLAERGVGIGVGAAGLRNHRRQLGVAESGQRAHRAEQQEREDERGPGAVANHLAVRQHLPGCRRPDRRKDARADDGADREHDQITRAHDALQGLVGFGEQLGDGLSGEQLIHTRQPATDDRRPRTGTFEAVGGILRNEHEPPAWIEGEADQIAARDDLARGLVAIERKAIHAAPSRDGIDHEQLPLIIERQALGTAEPVVEAPPPRHPSKSGTPDPAAPWSAP